MVISPLEHPNLATGDPWATQPRYANAMAATAAGLIALWSLHHHMVAPLAFRDSRRSNALARWLSSRPIGLLNTTAAKGGQSHIHSSTIALGVLLLMSVFFLIPFTVATFAIMPYYRTLSVYGSPPLALRAGFMALGTMPFLYATSAKVSYLTALTGVKSETWLVWHAWGARFCLFLATVHTIPFIYQPLHEGGSAQLSEVFQSDNIYTTGILAYVALALLVLPSGRFIRQRWYALWLAVHLPVALVFLAAMWVHCENILTSWRFMYAATFFYLLNIALRAARVLQNSDFFMHTTAELSVFTEPKTGRALTRIVVPTMARWHPGQHVYIRLLPSLPSRGKQDTASVQSYSLFAFIRFWLQSAAHSHPFTIVSLPPEDRHAPLGHMVLLARGTGTARGWSGKLAEWVRIGAGVQHVDEPSAGLATVEWTVIVDGPFGSTSTPALLDTAHWSLPSVTTSSAAVYQSHVRALQTRSPLARHDGVLFISGGSGITFALGMLLELVWARSKADALRTIQTEKKEASVSALHGQTEHWPQRVLFVWTVRSESHVAWAEEQLRIAAELASSISGDWLEIVVHVTGSASAPVLPQTTPPSKADTPASSVKSPSLSQEPSADTTGAMVADEAGLQGADVPMLSSASVSSSTDLPTHWHTRRGERIDPGLILQDFLGSLPPRANSRKPTVGMVVCGPHSLAEDASRAANAVQQDIFRGRETSYPQLQELEVFREDFGR